MKVVKFDCPGKSDPQPIYCDVPDAVPGGWREPGQATAVWQSSCLLDAGPLKGSVLAGGTPCIRHRANTAQLLSAQTQLQQLSRQWSLARMASREGRPPALLQLPAPAPAPALRPLQAAT